MNLSPADAELFFRLMTNLLAYVNQQLKILPDIKSAQDYLDSIHDAKRDIRAALWKKPQLIDAYVAKNPNGFSNQELVIIKSWKRFIAGKFQIARYLKTHAIFIGEKSQIYGVLGLYDSFDDLFAGRALPVMVETVLLPFKGQIVYDGIMNIYNIFFGGGIRSSLKDEYLRAKQNNRIIMTLEPEIAAAPQAKPPKKPEKDWKPTIEEIVKASAPLKGATPLESAAFSLLRAAANVAQTTLQGPTNVYELEEAVKQISRALKRFQTVMVRIEE
jgi:hypothetical protein